MFRSQQELPSQPTSSGGNSVQVRPNNVKYTQRSREDSDWRKFISDKNIQYIWTIIRINYKMNKHKFIILP